MSILLIGGYGKLGSAFPLTIPRTMKETKDFGDIEKEIRLRRPKYVINCAGLVGHQCSDPCITYDANVALPIHLAKVCQSIGAMLIQYSTFYDGETLYHKSKRIMEDVLLDMPNVTIIYIPSLFNSDFNIAHYEEEFHVAYTKDVAEWTLEHLDTVDVYLCNEGYPSRKDFIEYVGREFKPIERIYDSEEFIDDDFLIEMRYWKEAIDEIRTI